MRISALECLLLLAPALAMAQDVPPNEYKVSPESLKGWCDVPSVSACAMYVTGVMEGTREAMRSLGLPAPFCFNHPVAPGELALIMRKYLNDHSGNLTDTAATEIVAALRSTFPCRGDRQL